MEINTELNLQRHEPLQNTLSIWITDMDVLFMYIILTMLISKREINNLVIIYY